MFLVDDEVEFVSSDVHVFLVLLHVELFGLLQAYFHTRLAEVFDECFALWHTFEGTEECQLACLFLFLICATHFGFGFGEEFGGQGVLGTNEQLYAVFVFIIHLVFAFWYRTADDEWCTCIVNEDGVHLVHDGVVVTTLYEVHRAGRHIIAQVVKTKLVVGTECDIACIRTATLVGVRFLFVNTVHG